MVFLRRVIVAVLTIVLVLTGAGRALVLADAQPQAAIAIDGVVIAVCHAGSDTSPGQTQHDCCDACLLMAPTLVPTPPELATPIELVYVVDHSHATTWVPVASRARSPRQSQGPPTA